MPTVTPNCDTYNPSPRLCPRCGRELPAVGDCPACAPLPHNPLGPYPVMPTNRHAPPADRSGETPPPAADDNRASPLTERFIEATADHPCAVCGKHGPRRAFLNAPKRPCGIWHNFQRDGGPVKYPVYECHGTEFVYNEDRLPVSAAPECFRLIAETFAGTRRYYRRETKKEHRRRLKEQEEKKPPSKPEKPDWHKTFNDACCRIEWSPGYPEDQKIDFREEPLTLILGAEFVKGKKTPDLSDALRFLIKRQGYTVHVHAMQMSEDVARKNLHDAVIEYFAAHGLIAQTPADPDNPFSIPITDEDRERHAAVRRQREEEQRQRWAQQQSETPVVAGKVHYCLRCRRRLMQAKWKPSLLVVFRLRCNSLLCPGCFQFHIDRTRARLHKLIDKDYAAGRPWHRFPQNLTDKQIDAVDAKLRRRRGPQSDSDEPPDSKKPPDPRFQREAIQQAGRVSTVFVNAPLGKSRKLPATVPIPTAEEAKVAVNAALETAVAVESERQSKKPPKTNNKRLRFQSSTAAWRERANEEDAKFIDLGRVEKMPREIKEAAKKHGATYKREYPREGLMMCKETIQYHAMNKPLTTETVQEQLNKHLALIRDLLGPSDTPYSSQKQYMGKAPILLSATFYPLFRGNGSGNGLTGYGRTFSTRRDSGKSRPANTENRPLDGDRSSRVRTRSKRGEAAMPNDHHARREFALKRRRKRLAKRQARRQSAPPPRCYVCEINRSQRIIFSKDRDGRLGDVVPLCRECWQEFAADRPDLAAQIKPLESIADLAD
jgi:hypothetical protein